MHSTVANICNLCILKVSSFHINNTVTKYIRQCSHLISLTAHTVKSDSHVIVTPTDSDPSICGDHAVCDTLSNLISDSSGTCSSDANLMLGFLNEAHTVVISSRKLKNNNCKLELVRTAFGFVFNTLFVGSIYDNGTILIWTYYAFVQDQKVES